MSLLRCHQRGPVRVQRYRDHDEEWAQDDASLGVGGLWFHVGCRGTSARRPLDLSVSYKRWGAELRLRVYL